MGNRWETWAAKARYGTPAVPLGSAETAQWHPSSFLLGRSETPRCVRENGGKMVGKWWENDGAGVMGKSSAPSWDMYGHLFFKSSYDHPKTWKKRKIQDQKKRILGMIRPGKWKNHLW